MSHRPGEEAQYKRLPKYPHMKPADVTIWERYIDTNPDAYDSVIYDLAVGAGAPVDENLENYVKRDIKYLTQRKIDVVGRKNGEIHIIEVKPNAGPSAFGQVLAYAELYKRYISATEKIAMIVITDASRPDMENVAAELKIKLIAV